MCKKNQPGCIGCCKPVVSRVDPFDNWWKCWKGNFISPPPAYDPVLAWSIDSGAGEAYKLFTNTTDANKAINVDMVRLPLPLSVEYKCTIVALPGSVNRSFQMQFNDGATAAITLNGNSTGIASGNASYTNSPMTNVGTFNIPTRIPLPVTVRMRVQFDTDGCTYWVHLNGSTPALSLGQPFGVKQTGSVSFPDLLTANKSRIGLTVGTSSITPVGSEYVRIDNFEAHVWNHVVDPRAWP